MYRLIEKQPLSIITYDPLEVCGGVCICRDPALCLDFLILLSSGRFWASTFGQWCVASSQKQHAGCEHVGSPEALSLKGGANFQRCVFKLTNPAHYAFNLKGLFPLTPVRDELKASKKCKM